MSLPIDKFRGGAASARERLNRMVEVLNTVLHSSSDGFIQLQRSPNGITFRLALDRLVASMPKEVESWFFAELTDDTAGIYDWDEVRLDTAGEWETWGEGRSGTQVGGDGAEPLIPRTGITIDTASGADPTVVLMFPRNKAGEGTKYLFLDPGADPSSVLFWFEVQAGSQIDGDGLPFTYAKWDAGDSIVTNCEELVTRGGAAVNPPVATNVTFVIDADKQKLPYLIEGSVIGCMDDGDGNMLAVGGMYPTKNYWKG